MENLKKTKIICTISDRRCEPEFIKALYENGMNVVRINSAHTSIESSSKIADNVRKVSDKIAILIDTKGPEIRLTTMTPESGVKVKTGDIVSFKDDVNGISCEDCFFTNYKNFSQDIPVGAEILIDDGDASFIVKEKKDRELICVAGNDSTIKGKKSINVPGVSIKLPSLTERDKEFILWAIDYDLDFVAHSFVRSAKDLEEINNIIRDRKSHLKIISKIENQEGVDNITEILEDSYGIMIARGDLGIEIPAEKIPIIQRDIVNKCRLRKRPVIVATQMLHTMIENPRPTRAEISDVANAIFEYTDAIMLSGETASGKYPIEAVQTMSKVAREIEAHHAPSIDLALTNVTEPISVILAKSIVEASINLPMKCIVIDTTSGRTGRYLSAFRPNIPIFADCYSEPVQRMLALSYGIYCEVVENVHSKDNFVKRSVNTLYDKKLVDKSSMIGVLAGSFGATTGASFIEIATVTNLIK